MPEKQKKQPTNDDYYKSKIDFTSPNTDSKWL